MSEENEKIKKRYNRISKVYDRLEKPMDSMASNEWRDKIIEKIEGQQMLEVGVGTGKNLVYYPDNLDISGIDFSVKMLDHAREKVKGLQHIQLIEMDAQKMAFADNTFDTVVSSCVFCSVPDPVAGLREIRRVCKNNGKIVMLEHMRSSNEVIGKFMDLINFIPLHIWGANINRKTLDNLKKAGFKEENIQTKDLWTDIVKLIEIRNEKE